jgi:hypothetical protein
MSTELDPLVVGKLRQFGRRRRGLIWLRGICAAVVSLFVLMSLVAFADWSWVLSTQTRWMLSVLAYAGVAVSVWFACLRRMVHRPSMDDLASKVELAEPELRENLLSAVELAVDDPSAINDSPTFRRLLQGKVAERMASVRVSSLLPWRLLGGWIVAALLLVGLTVALLYSPTSPLRVLVTRAVLPGANIARVSRIHVEILKPTPHSMTLAEDETVAVMVKISGGDVSDVSLEMTSPNQGTSQQSMRSQGDSVYVFNVAVADEPIDYRILAGDAVTKLYRLESRPRPQVLAFEKTFRFPEYSGLAESKVVEKHGDLIALEGTETDLVLEVDQAVTDAEIHLESQESDEVRIIPLVADGPNRLRATLPLDEPAVYKIHLVSKETGFVNIFSPKYEVRPEPDLIPRVGFVDQQETTLLLPPNDILPLAAMAEDDLPLVSLEQQYSVNGHDWVGVALDSALAARMTANWDWDLIPLNLERGDQVMTRLVATDRKGNVGESVPLRIVVSSTDFDPGRHKATLRKSGFYSELAEFAEIFAGHKIRAKETLDRLRDEKRDGDQKRLDRATLRDMATTQFDAAAKLGERIEELIREMPPGSDSHELDLVGRTVARLQHEYAAIPVQLVNKLQQDGVTPQEAAAHYTRIQQTFDRSADDSNRLAESFRDMMAHNVLAAIAFDLDALMQQQRAAVRWASPSWQRLVRQETVVLGQLRMLKTLIADQLPSLPESTSRPLIAYLDWLDMSIERLEQGMESEDKLSVLQSTAATLLRDLEGRQRVDVADGRLPGSLVNARRDFDNRSGTLFGPIQEMGGRANEVFARTTKLVDTTDPIERLKVEQELAENSADLQVHHVNAAGQLQARRNLTQARPDADTQYAVDAGLTNRALARLHRTHLVDPLAEPLLQEALSEIAPAYQILAAGHETSQARQLLGQLLTMERWRSQEIEARLDHPRQWDTLLTQFELAARRLRDAKVPNDIASRVDQLRWSPASVDAKRKISARRHQRDTLVSAGYELNEMQEELNVVFNELDPILDAARAVIAKYVPSIPEMAQETADAIRALEEQTAAAADQIENPQATEPQETPPPTLEELQEEQEKINDQVDELIDALIEDANQQDVLEDEEIERARDADASIEMIRDAAEEMNQAMDEATAAEQPEQAKELAEAAEEQEKTADILEKVAEHFEKLDAGEDVTESRQELRPENDAASGEPQDAQPQDAQPQDAQPQDAQPQDANSPKPSPQSPLSDLEQLAAEARENPLDLIRALEEELKRNPAMQDALSEISQNTLEQARNALDDAAREDDNLQRQIERADAEFQNEKKELINELKAVTQEAVNVANNLVAQANSAAAQGKDPEDQKKLAAAQQQLRNAQAKTNQLNDNKLLAEVEAVAEEVRAAVADSSKQLEEATKGTEEAKTNEIHADDKARQAAKKTMEANRKKFQDQRVKTANDVAKRAADAEKRTAQAVNKAEAALKNAAMQAERAEANAKKNPTNAGLKNAENQARVNEDKASAVVEAAKTQQQQAKAVADAAAEDAKQLSQKPLAPLDAANPAAELASEFAKEAAEQVAELAKRADELAESPNRDSELQAPEAALTQTNQRQQEIKQDVDQVALDVARAARHERRLENNDPVEALENAAEAISEVADGQVQESIERLTEATDAEAARNEAAANGETPAAETPAGEIPADAKDSESAVARDTVEEAETALADQAEQLGGILADAQAADDAAEEAALNGETPEPAAGEPAAGEPGAGEPAAGEPGAGEPAAGESGAGGPAPPQPPGPATPAQLERAELLAQTLDELDQRQADAAANGAPVSTAPLASLAAAAQSQRASMAAARAPYGSETLTPFSTPGDAIDSQGIPPGAGELGRGFAGSRVNRDDGKEWGALRGKSAEDTAKGRREAVAAEYRERVEAYFRVLAEQARAKK